MHHFLAWVVVAVGYVAVLGKKEELLAQDDYSTYPSTRLPRSLFVLCKLVLLVPDRPGDAGRIYRPLDKGLGLSQISSQTFSSSEEQGAFQTVNGFVLVNFNREFKHRDRLSWSEKQSGSSSTVQMEVLENKSNATGVSVEWDWCAINCCVTLQSRAVADFQHHST